MKLMRPTMKQELNEWAERLAVLANGSSGGRDVAVNESFDANELFVELDGPQTYLTFQLRDGRVLAQFLRFLESSSWPSLAPDQSSERAECALILGRFGSASVSLLRDNEDFPRCFLVVGPDARSTLRLSLEAEDIRMLSEVLRQVLRDLPLNTGE